jgi:VWFA-related protein
MNGRVCVRSRRVQGSAIASALGLFGILAAPAVVTAQLTFSSRLDAVRVDVSVRRGDQAVTGLGAKDFEVRDNGVLQQVDLVGYEETPVHVVLALDTSGSVEGQRLTQLRSASVRLMRALRPGDTAALLTFADRIAIQSRLSGDVPSLIAALMAPPPTGDTALIDAAHAAMVLGEAESGRPLTIVFSDGADTASFLTPDLVLATARRTGSVVYAVTTSRSERSEFLDNLVEATGGRRLAVDSAERLSDTFAAILAESRQRYLISYTPRGVSGDGWHDVTVRVRVRDAQVRARPGYYAGR